MSDSSTSTARRSRTRSWASSLRIFSHGDAGRTRRSIVDAAFAVDRQRCSSWNEVAQHGVQLVGDTNPLRCKVRTAFLEQGEHRGVVLTGDRRGITVQRRDARSRRRVDHVGLAAAAA